LPEKEVEVRPEGASVEEVWEFYGGVKGVYFPPPSDYAPADVFG